MRTNLIKKALVDSTKKSSASIHLIHILDVSGSMSGPKGSASLKGIKQEILDIQKENLGIDYRYSLVIFSSEYKYIYCNQDINSLDVTLLNDISWRGLTGLYDALGVVLNEQQFLDDSKVLIKIFTDGEENCSTGYNVASVKSLIKNRQNLGWVITFIGTKRDTNFIIATLGIHEDNTLTHDNVAESITRVFQASNEARVLYSKAVLDGTDDNVSFYKSIKTE